MFDFPTGVAVLYPVGSSSTHAGWPIRLPLCPRVACREDNWNGMDTVGNTGAGHAPLHALPRFWIAFGKKGCACALQLCVACDFSCLLLALCYLRDAGEAREPDCLEPQAGRQRPCTWGRKDEEYIADFCLVSRRTLDEFEYRLFRYHFLLGADWKLCSRRLGMDRGNFFHAVYRIEQKLGPRYFASWSRIRCIPLDEYFHGPARMSGAQALRAATPQRSTRLAGRTSAFRRPRRRCT